MVKTLHIILSERKMIHRNDYGILFMFLTVKVSVHCIHWVESTDKSHLKVNTNTHNTTHPGDTQGSEI